MQWDELILGYLRSRKNLRRIFLSIDSKLGIKQNDAEIMEIFDSLGLVYQIILTKSDKKSAGVEDSVSQILQFHPSAFPQIISTSSKKGEGIKPLQAEIFQIIRQ
jgi:GTP-binding protein